MAALGGIFTQSDQQISTDNFDWLPVPVYSVSNDDDYFLSVTKQCDRFDYEVLQFLNQNDRFNKLIEHNKQLIDYIKRNSGLDQVSSMDIGYIYDALSIERSKGFR